MLAVYFGALVPTRLIHLYEKMVKENIIEELKDIEVCIINDSVSIVGDKLNIYYDYLVLNPEYIRDLYETIKKTTLQERIKEFIKIWNFLYENKIKDKEENFEKYQLPDKLELTVFIVSF